MSFHPWAYFKPSNINYPFPKDNKVFLISPFPCLRRQRKA